MRIMVPVDGSEFSEQALPGAFSIAGRSASEIHIARVYQFSGIVAHDAAISGGLAATIDREARDAEMKYMIALAARFPATGALTRSFSLDAPVADALARHIEEQSIDLVMMTTHGRGGLSRAWLGSVADRLIRATNVPVLLCRPRPPRVRGSRTETQSTPVVASHILIPLDGSSLAECIIEPAVELGAITGARYTLLQVVAPAIRASASNSAESNSDSMYLKHEALSYLEARAQSLRARGLTVEVRVVMQDNVAAAIAEECVHAECDLIAMATHGRTGWTRVALGSIADKVLRSAPVPLLILKPMDQSMDVEGASGSVNVNVVPSPSSLETRMVPLCASMIPLTIASPNPIP